MMTKEMTVYEGGRPLEATELHQQVQLIQQVMSSVMKEDEHYGTIPGTNKPTLYKPGAEKLSLTFRLAPSYTVTERALDKPGHFDCSVTCTLTHIGSGNVVGQGIGSCSTMESKYRYRGSEKEFTDDPVPKRYWDAKRDQDYKEAQKIIGGPGFMVGKTDEGRWMICKKGEKKENPDIADIWNTVRKMAKKRAHVDAILTATGASDIFTQDMEDIAPPEPVKDKPAKVKVVDIPEPAPEAVPTNGDEVINGVELKTFWTDCSIRAEELGIEKNTIARDILDELQLDSSKKIPKHVFGIVRSTISKWTPREPTLEMD
jgi:hypothetical protein